MKNKKGKKNGINKYILSVETKCGEKEPLQHTSTDTGARPGIRSRAMMKKKL